MLTDPASARQLAKRLGPAPWTPAGLSRDLKNSGTHWIKYMLSVALGAYCVPPPKYFSEAATQDYIGSPKHTSPHEALPACFAHTIPHRLMDVQLLQNAFNLPPYASGSPSHADSRLTFREMELSAPDRLDDLSERRSVRRSLSLRSLLAAGSDELQAKYPEKILRIHYEGVQETHADRFRRSPITGRSV